MNQKKKILIMGLSNAGKSSILLSLNGKKNLMEFFRLKPTKRIDRDQIIKGKKKYLIWDFGGQKRYRNEYIRNLKNNDFTYLYSVDKVIFVIDVQDEGNYDEALDYLKIIVQAIDKFNPDIKLSIFLHKFDPGLKEKEEFEEEVIKDRLIEKFEQIIPENIDFEVFRTSIFTIFQKSLYY